MDIIGYLGNSSKAEDFVSLPTHNETYLYFLKDIEVSSAMESFIADESGALLQTDEYTGVERRVAVEVVNRMSDGTLINIGFLKYDSVLDKYVLVSNNVTYYTLNAGVYTQVASPVEANFDDYYVFTGINYVDPTSAFNAEHHYYQLQEVDVYTLVENPTQANFDSGLYYLHGDDGYVQPYGAFNPNRAYFERSTEMQYALVENPVIGDFGSYKVLHDSYVKANTLGTFGSMTTQFNPIGNGATDDLRSTPVYNGPTTSANDTFGIVLHKWNINKEYLGDDKIVTFVFGLYEELGSGDDTYLVPASTTAHQQTFYSHFMVLRWNSTQSILALSGSHYDGISKTEQDIQVTDLSSVTVEIQTNYLPSMYSGPMTWSIFNDSRIYYYNNLTGKFIITDRSGTVLAYSVIEGAGTPVTIHSIAEAEPYLIVDDALEPGIVEKVSYAQGYGQPFPKGTKITIVDYTAGNEKPEYYYYICENDESEIDLANFCLMGTTETLGNDPLNPKAQFMKYYYSQSNAMVSERLVFIFDYAEADFGSYFDSLVPYTSMATLSHKIGSIDMMEYFYTDATSSHFATPSWVRYELDRGDEIGIQQITVNGGVAAPRISEMNVDVLLHYEKTIHDTRLETQYVTDENQIGYEFSDSIGLKIELGILDSGIFKPVPLPPAFAVRYGNNENIEYHAHNGDLYMIVPINMELFDIHGEHTVRLTFITSLYAPIEEDNGSLIIRITMIEYLDYEHDRDLTIASREQSVTLTTESRNALKVTTGVTGEGISDRLLTAGGSFDFTVETGRTVYGEGINKNVGTFSPILGEKVKLTAYRKVNGEYNVAQNVVDRLFAVSLTDGEYELTSSSAEQSLAVSATAPKGTYLLEFKYEDKTEYLTVYVKDANG